MKEFDRLLTDQEEFRTHVYGCLRAALKHSRALLRPNMTRAERVGSFVSALKRADLSVLSHAQSFYSKRDQRRWEREFPGAPDSGASGADNPHNSAKRLARELLITGNWIEPCVLRTNSFYTEGTVMETLARKALRDHEADQGETVDFSSVGSALDSMRFCLEDTEKLVQAARVSTNDYDRAMKEIEDSSLKAALGQ